MASVAPVELSARPSGVASVYRAQGVAGSFPIGLLFYGCSTLDSRSTFAGAEVTLLMDSATGYHIRVGDYILTNGHIPMVHAKFYTARSALVRLGMAIGCLVLARLSRCGDERHHPALSGDFCLQHVARASRDGVARSNALIAIVLLHFGLGAASIHFLARPHILTLFMAIGIAMLRHDRVAPSRTIWWLIPLTALWVNLHGGFAGLLVSLLVLAHRKALGGLGYSGSSRPMVLDPSLRDACRSMHACVGAQSLRLSRTCPYRRIRSAKMDYRYGRGVQSPRFQSASSLYFEGLLFGGLMLAASLFYRRRIAEGLLIVARGHLAPSSVRHIPIFVLVATPLLAAELTGLWNRFPKPRPLDRA